MPRGKHRGGVVATWYDVLSTWNDSGGDPHVKSVAATDFGIAVMQVRGEAHRLRSEGATGSVTLHHVSRYESGSISRRLLDDVTVQEGDS